MSFLSGWHVLISEETATQPLVSVLLSTWSKLLGKELVYLSLQFLIHLEKKLWQEVGEGRNLRQELQQRLQENVAF